MGISCENEDWNTFTSNESSKLWVFNAEKVKESQYISGFFKNNSSTFHDLGVYEEIKYGTGFAKGYISKDKVSFNYLNQSVELKFILADDSDVTTYDGIVGFGLDEVHNKRKTSSILKKERELLEFNLMASLFKKGIIKNNLFSIHLEENKGILAIGERPQLLIDYIKKRGDDDFVYKCNISKSNTEWECEGRMIKMKGRKAIEINRNTNFLIDTGSTTTFISKWLLRKIYDTYFKIYKDKCFIDYVEENMQTIICKKEVISELDVIFIQLGKDFISISPEDYFVHLEKELYSFEMIYHITEDDDEFDGNIIGMSLLHKYFVIFDRSERRIEWALNPLNFKNEEYPYVIRLE